MDIKAKAYIATNPIIRVILPEHYRKLVADGWCNPNDFSPLYEPEPSVPVSELEDLMYWGKSGAEYARDLKNLIAKHKGIE